MHPHPLLQSGAAVSSGAWHNSGAPKQHPSSSSSSWRPFGSIQDAFSSFRGGGGGGGGRTVGRRSNGGGDGGRSRVPLSSMGRISSSDMGAPAQPEEDEVFTLVWGDGARSRGQRVGFGEGRGSLHAHSQVRRVSGTASQCDVWQAMMLIKHPLSHTHIDPPSLCRRTWRRTTMTTTPYCPSARR